jgi:cytochrome P450
MMRLTMEIAGKTLLGIEVGDEFNKITRLLESTMYDFLGRFSAAVPLPFWVPTLRNIRLRHTVRQLDRILQSLIDRRRAQGAGGGDFLSLLLNAKDEQDGRGISDRQIRDEVMTMFLAGHETTAVALCWTWLLLAQHPEIQERVAAEATAVLGDREPVAADVPKLIFCEQVIRESMRLYPPAYVVGRRPIEDITIGGHFIRAGTNVLMSQWIVHRDPRWYDEPLRFNPERWADGLASRLPKYAYFPFGGGPRLCLAMIARRFRLSLAKTGEIRIQPAVTLRPRDPIPMRIEKR